MSLKSEMTAAAVTAPLHSRGSKYTYSLKRWDAFEAWQVRVRGTATSSGSTSFDRPARDLHRALVRG